MNVDPCAYRTVPAPAGTTRLIPSRFPPVSAFDAVTSPEDLEAVMFLEGWTNDRLVAPRLARLDREEWVFGRPNASVVMAAFLHGSPTGQRFSDASLGAWYAASALMTSVLEVANGLRREVALSALTTISGTYRQYKADLSGAFIDIFDKHPEYHALGATACSASQALGRAVRDLGPGSPITGIRYQSVRHEGHDNWVCFRPPAVGNVVQADHFRIDARQTGSVVVHRLA